MRASTTGRSRVHGRQRARSTARLFGAMVLVGGLAVGATGPGPHASAREPQPRIPLNVIKHVVVIFQENHSFDETLGDYCIVHTGRCDGSIGPVKLSNGSTVPLR